MAGYYDEITGEFITTGDGYGYSELDDTSGTGTVGDYPDIVYTGYQDPSEVTEIDNPTTPGQAGYGWKYYSDGTAISPQGEYYYQGEKVWGPSGGGILDRLGGGVASALKAAFTKDGKVDWRAVAGAAGGLYGLYQATQKQEKSGYQGKIPTYEAQRTRLELPEDPNRRPGEFGRRYFSDVVFAAPTPAAPPAEQPEQPNQQPAEQTETQTLAAGGLTGMYEMEVESPYARKDAPKQDYATGGLAGLAQGKYLRGHTDGMADKIPARIGKDQPAALSHGEFVVPADVVSHLGNGNSDAGAERLYEMMNRIRKARTGTTKQGKQVNPNKFLPS